MSAVEFLGPDPRRSRLRAAVASIEAAMSLLPADSGPGRFNLLAAWKDLVDQLALGPEPAVRECPACHRICMWDATACGYCFRPLLSLGPAPDLPSRV